MKFSEMIYQRPELETLTAEMTALTARLKDADRYETAREVFLEKEKLDKRVQTQATLAEVRHTIDTRDAFYDEEVKFWNNAMPELQEYAQAWTKTMLASPFRKDFAAEYGDLMFVNAEIQLKTFSPEIIPELQQENDLTQEYEKLLASAQIPFENGVYTLSQLSPFKNDPDDSRRLAAWQAEGGWYKANQPKLDEIYDKLVRLRDTMGRKLGYDGYTELGYYRMGRNCYTKEDVEKFRAAVVEYLVPVADSIYKEQAERLGKSYPLSFADAVNNEHVIEQTLRKVGVAVDDGVATLPEDSSKYITYGKDGKTVVKERCSFEGEADVNGTPCTWSAVLSYDYTTQTITGNLSDTVRIIYVYVTKK